MELNKLKTYPIETPSTIPDKIDNETLNINHPMKKPIINTINANSSEDKVPAFK